MKLVSQSLVGRAVGPSSGGRYKTWTLDSGLDYGLDYGLDFGLGWTLNSVLELLFKEDFECWIAQ